MTQLSLIPALEAARYMPAKSSLGTSEASMHSYQAMAPANRPTAAQIRYLKQLTRIKTDSQLARFVARQLGVAGERTTKAVLTRQDFAKVIDKEVAERRWAA